MRSIFAFNGDADGLCAMQQLRLTEGLDRDAGLVSGPKRQIDLVRYVEAGAGDTVTVLDLSFRVNRAAVEALLALGTRVRYFDHHETGALPQHALFEAHIDTSPETCTSVLVDRYLGGAHRAWAAVGAYGDNLDRTAAQLVAALCLGAEARERLRDLGIALNYNAYGESEADLLFRPVELHARLARHRDPLEFVRDDPAYGSLRERYEEDMQRCTTLRPVAENTHAALYVLPEAPWAKRVNGVLANLLARREPGRAHAVLVRNAAGGMAASVRAPVERPTGAAALCAAFASGGGREAAAGINHLDADEVEEFGRRFLSHFR